MKNPGIRLNARSPVPALLLAATLGAGCSTVRAAPNAAAADNRALAQPSLLTPGSAPAERASVPSDGELVVLLRSTLDKVDYGNKTGDYHSLYSQLTPQVQKVIDLPKLAAALEGFRKLRVDMTPVSRTEPLFEHPPQLTPDGFLLVRGTFPTSPREIRFDFGFERTEGQWRIQALNLDTPGTGTPAASGSAAPSAAPQASAPPPPPPRARVDSPFLDPSTDPPTATKW